VGADCGIVVMKGVVRQKEEKFAKTSFQGSVWHTLIYSPLHMLALGNKGVISSHPGLAEQGSHFLPPRPSRIGESFPPVISSQPGLAELGSHFFPLRPWE